MGRCHVLFKCYNPRYGLSDLKRAVVLSIHCDRGDCKCISLKGNALAMGPASSRERDVHGRGNR